MSNTLKAAEKKTGKTSKVVIAIVVLLIIATQICYIPSILKNGSDKYFLLGAMTGRLVYRIGMTFFITSLINKFFKVKRKNICLIVVAVLIVFTSSIGGILSAKHKAEDEKHFQEFQNLMVRVNENVKNEDFIEKEVITSEKYGDYKEVAEISQEMMFDMYNSVEDYVNNIYGVDIDWITSEELIKSEENLSQEIAKLESVYKKNRDIIERFKTVSRDGIEKLRKIELEEFSIPTYIEGIEEFQKGEINVVVEQAVKFDELYKKVIEMLNFFKDNISNFEVIDEKIIFEDDGKIEKCKEILQDIYTLTEEVVG